MKNRTLYTAGLILSTLGINAQQKVGITYQVEYRDGITNERIYRTPHSVITELIDGVATATVTEIANLPKGYKLLEGQEATITQTVTKGQTNILTFRVKTTDQSTKLEEGTELRRIANGTRNFSWSAGTNPSFEYVIPENLGGFEHVRRDIRFNVSIANNPFLQGGNNNNWNYHILDFERIQQADLRDYIADSYIASRHPFIFLTTTGTTPQWGSSDNPAASRILGNTWSNNTRELQLGFDLAIHHLVPTGTYSFPIRLWYPLQQGQTYWTTPLKDELVFEVKVVNNYLKFDMEQTRLTTAANNRSQADDLAQRHTVSGTTNLESGAQIRFKNQNGTILGNTTVGTNGRWSATITGLKSGDTLTAEIGRAGYYFMSDTLLVEDGSAPYVPNATVSLYRGEAYPGKVLTAQDNLAITSLTTTPASPGAGGTFSVSGGDLSLTGTAALEPSRTNPNTTTTSTYTVTARDGGNRTGTGTLTIQLKPQTDAYTAVARTGLTFDSNNATPQAASLLTVNRSADSRLSTTPSGARYEFVGAGVNMNQIGEQTVKVRATYADGSTDEVTVTVSVRDTTAPTGSGVTWTRYRGEAYGSQPFFTVTDNTSAPIIRSSNPSPPSTDTSAATSLRRGASGNTVNYTVVGSVPLTADLGTTTYTYATSDRNPFVSGNQGTVSSTLTIKAQTEAYDATAKPTVSVAKGTALTTSDPLATLVNVTKVASTLANPDANGKLSTATYSWEGTAIDTNTLGNKTGKVRVTYADSSTDIVDVTVNVANQAPTVATPNTVVVWKDQVIQRPVSVTASDPDGRLTAAQFKTNTTANRPANIDGISVSTTGTNVTIGGTPTVVAGEYTRRLEVTDNNNTSTLSDAFKIYVLSAENRTLDLTSRATPTADQVTAEALRGVTGNTGNDTITATVVGTIPAANDTNRTVQVDLRTSTGEVKRVTVTLNYPANQTPTVGTAPAMAVWAGQPIQNPVKVDVTDPDGTIVSVRPNNPAFPMPTGMNLRLENGQVVIDGTPDASFTADNHRRSFVVRDDSGAERQSNQFDLNILKASDQTLAATNRTQVTAAQIIAKAREGLEGTTAAKNAVRADVVGDIPTPAQADAGNNKVQVRLTTSSGESKTISITINYPPAICTKPAITTGTALETIVGISDIRTNTDEWPHSRKGGWIALESNNKGFVINRLSTAQIRNITHPQEGMIAYDTTEKCLKIFNGTEWKCFSNPVCPQH